LGDADAQNNLGVVCANGRSVESDLKTARELWTKSAAQGKKDEAIAAGLKQLDDLEGRTTPTLLFEVSHDM